MPTARYRAGKVGLLSLQQADFSGYIYKIYLYICDSDPKKSLLYYEGTKDQSYCHSVNTFKERATEYYLQRPIPVMRGVPIIGRQVRRRHVFSSVQSIH